MTHEREISRRIALLAGKLGAAPGSRAGALLDAGGELARMIRADDGRPTPHRCGVALEAMIAMRGEERRKTGAFYTPPWLVEHTLSVCLDPLVAHARARGGDRALIELRVCDPACGSGNFLLAAAERIARAGATLSLDDVLCECIHGVDVNPDAAALCRAVLAEHAPARADRKARLDAHVLAGDAIGGRWPSGSHAGPGLDWSGAFAGVFARGGFDAVVGNPPYLNQLESATVQSRGAAEHLKLSSEGLITGYADLAAAFWALAARLVREPGRFALVLPRAVLSSRDGRALRSSIAAANQVTHLWLSEGRAFDASVYTCVVACSKGRGATHTVSISAGEPPVAAGSVEVATSELVEKPTWSALAAQAEGVPRFRMTTNGVVGDIATATADFRDEYYGLEGFIVDSMKGSRAAFPKLVTTGLIDLARNRWGEIRTRVLKRAWVAPRLDLLRMKREGALGAWATKRLVPKLIFATQTRALECVADPKGELLPVTPLISVFPARKSALWKLCAALGSPVLSALAAREFGGAALHADAIKLSAKQLLTLPLPADLAAWDQAGEAFREASLANDDRTRRARLRDCGVAMMRAYGVPVKERAALMRWWETRALGPRRQPKAFL